MVTVGVVLLLVLTVILPVVELVKKVASILVAPEPVNPQVPLAVPIPPNVIEPTVSLDFISAFAPVDITKEFVFAPSADVLFITKVPSETVVVPV